MSVVFRTNDEGRIYGATFIDHEKKCVFNGSRLGREFSANVFNDVFIGHRQTPEQRVEHSDHRSGHENENRQPDKLNIENSNSGGIFSLFIPDFSPANDYEEQAFLRRTKKKKKQQRHL